MSQAPEAAPVPKARAQATGVDIGIVFRKPRLLPWIDVLGLVTFPLRHEGPSVTAGRGTARRDCASRSGSQGSRAGPLTHWRAACGSGWASPGRGWSTPTWRGSPAG